MKSNRQLLIEHVRQNPADREVLLVLADLVQEEGDDELALLLRLHAYPNSELKGPERSKLKGTKRGLRKRLQRRLITRYGWYGGDRIESWDKGLPAGIRIGFDVLESSGEELLREWPIRAVELSFRVGNSITWWQVKEAKVKWGGLFPTMRWTWSVHIQPSSEWEYNRLTIRPAPLAAFLPYPERDEQAHPNFSSVADE